MVGFLCSTLVYPRRRRDIQDIEIGNPLVRCSDENFVLSIRGSVNTVGRNAERHSQIEPTENFRRRHDAF